MLPAAGAAVSTPVAVQAVEPSAAGMEEVVIVSRRLEESLPQELAVSGSRVTTVTADQIANGGFNDVAQALQYSVPGLYLAPASGQFSYVDVSLQGSRSSDILWLVDGIRINNRLYASTMPLDTIPSHMVERIEVLEGAQGLFYGSQAVAGVINVITKDFTERFDSAVEVGLDTNGGRHVSGYLRGALGRSHVVAFASLDEGDGFRPFRARDYQPSATDRERGYDVKSGGIKFLHDFSDTVRFSASYQHTEADVELLQPALIARNVNSRDEDLISAKLDVQLGERVDLYVKGYYHDWDTSYDTVRNSLTTPGELIVVNDDTFWGFSDYGANALVRLKLNEGLEYFLGYDIQRYGGRDEELLIAPNKEQTQAYFGQIRTTDDFSSRLHLSAGVRHNAPSDASSATVWMATGKYDISDNLFVRGVLGTGFRLPSAEELYAIDPTWRGNPNLVPEKSENLNISVGGFVPAGSRGVSWELIGFFRDVTNLISFEPDEAEEIDIATNIPGTVKVRGATLALSAPLGEAFSGRVSYTRNDSQNDSGKQIARIPESLVQAALDYSSPSSRFGASLVANRIGDQYVTTVSAGDVAYGDYTLVDLNARLFLDPGKRHRLGVRLENAFDEEYGRPGEARTDVGNARYVIVNRGTPRTWHATYTYTF